MELVILAAGMGSRYGGLKQIDPITDEGEFIIDFSVYDAVKSGFDKIVFIIKEENLEDFRETIGKRFENIVKCEYAFQKPDDLPNGYTLNPNRIKPWGTTQALLAARDIVKEPFAVINADDFYGRSAFTLLANHLKNLDVNSTDYCMIGYILENTLTENGQVARGECSVENGYLQSIVERTKIEKRGNTAYLANEEKEIPLSTVVSMNCWGFTPAIFSQLKDSFSDFLKDNCNEPKQECYLPNTVQEIMQKDNCTVKVYPSVDHWYGVTYSEDKGKVYNSLKALKENGTYPKYLKDVK
jgi:UTP-glucose-1-phosphate uridylyltransferase